MGAIWPTEARASHAGLAKTRKFLGRSAEMRRQSTARSHVIALADRLGVRYQPSTDEALAAVVIRLSGDEVVSDDVEDLIVALRRAESITGAEMVELLSLYLNEKYSG
jgi:hypothetical protein